MNFIDGAANWPRSSIRGWQASRDLAATLTRVRLQHWHLYVIEVDEKLTRISRDDMIEALKARNIGTSVHFIPLHRHPAYARYDLRPESLPVSEEVFKRIISLPLYPKMTDSDAQDVIAAILDVLGR